MACPPCVKGRISIVISIMILIISRISLVILIISLLSLVILIISLLSLLEVLSREPQGQREIARAIESPSERARVN